MQRQVLPDELLAAMEGGGTGLHCLQDLQYVSKPPIESCQTIVKLYKATKNNEKSEIFRNA